MAGSTFSFKIFLQCLFSTVVLIDVSFSIFISHLVHSQFHTSHFIRVLSGTAVAVHFVICERHSSNKNLNYVSAQMQKKYMPF